MESNAEIRKWQEAARAAKVKADLEKLQAKKVPMQPHEHLVLEKKQSFQIHENEGGPPPAIPRGMPVESVASIKSQIIDRKKEAAKRWREKNREKLAAAERERRKK